MTQWPGARATNLAGLAGGERLDRSNDALAALTALNMAQRVELERPASARSTGPVNSTAKPDMRYGATSAAVSQIAERDQVRRDMSTGSSRALTWNDEEYRKQRRHEDLVIRVMAAFSRQKCPVAAGPRCTERFPGGGVNPDGLIYLVNGPFGTGWYYVEVELSAKFLKRVSKRLSRYGSPDRRSFFPGDDEPPPVLWIVRSEKVEKIFHQAGAGIRMLTIPVSRFSSRAPMEGWSRFGEMVNLS